MVSDYMDSDIAVIGMSCRVAGAKSPAELWNVLASSKDVQREITRFSLGIGFYHPDGGVRKGLTNVKSAYMMDDKAVECFDHAFFHITPLEAAAMDPQHRMLLEIAYEAVESAGIPLDHFVGSDTAVYAGMEGSEYHSVLARDIDATPDYLATGTATCMSANRISYAFDLSGPSIVVDTACSSAMAALHQAVRSLRGEEARMALVCGAKLILSPDMFVPSSEMGFLSSSGRCRSFDAEADGYGRGEGVLALLLKPLKAALDDGDPVRAVIKGTRLNQDGRTRGITLPSAEAQRRNMQSLYQTLNLSPNDIQYLEAHGTGTAAGDPLEFSAISRVFGDVDNNRDEPLVVGSIKSNVGHLESSSALAAVIKTILCLEKGKIPAQMHFLTPNPNINFQGVKIPVELIDWPGSELSIRRAGVNTFGAGGTNGHVVLEACSRDIKSTVTPEKPLLFKVSAADDKSLERLSFLYAEYIETSKPSIRDLAHTLLSRRSTLTRSVFVVARTNEEITAELKSGSLKTNTKRVDNSREIAFVYTGQGAQWAQMGKSLIDQSLIFKGVLLECERALANLPDKPAWSIIEELSKAKNESNVYKSQYSQPLCTALQIGLTEIWRSWGLVPKVVVGHSSGEIGAAYAAGFISLPDAIIIAYYRGLVLATAPLVSSPHDSQGSMCAIGLGEQEVTRLLEKFSGRIQLAAVNSPTTCTISGDRDAIKDIVMYCAKSGAFCRELRVDRGEIILIFELANRACTDGPLAYHSHHMLPLASPYEESLTSADIVPRLYAGGCDMFSSVTGRGLTKEDCSPSYWRQNMVSTVQFSRALEACLVNHPKLSLILEVGPHPALKAPILETLRSLGRDSINYYSCCSRGVGDLEAMLENAGSMIGFGVPLKAANINAREIPDGPGCNYEFGEVLTDVPSYQWNHSVSLWKESRVSRSVRFRQFPRNQLLGSRYVDDVSSRPSWRNLLMLKEIPWLVELKTNGATEMPIAAYVLMALEAARQLQILRGLKTSILGLTDIVLSDGLSLAKFHDVNMSIELQFVGREIVKDSCFEFEVFSANTGLQSDWTQHCSGKFHLNYTSINQSHLSECTDSYDPILLDQSQPLRFDASRRLKYLQISSQGATGLFDEYSSPHENYPVDPLVLDSILCLSPASLLARNLPATYKLRSIGSIISQGQIENVGPGRFLIGIESTHSFGCQSNIEIHQAGVLISLGNLYHEVDKLIEPTPILKSLFFKPISLPDITKLPQSDSMSISDCLRLITHKWPMTNVKVAGLEDHKSNVLLETLQNIGANQRQHYQSVQILGPQRETSSNCTKYVDNFDVDIKAHFMLCSNCLSVAEIYEQLEPNGFLCARKIGKKEKMEYSVFLEFVCKVTGLDHDDWTLWRKAEGEALDFADRRKVIFGGGSLDPSLMIAWKATEYIPLQEIPVQEFCGRNDESKFDAIIIDDLEKSVITTWAGKLLLPWLQVLLKSAAGILWVTQQGPDNPFNNVAGTLLRTLQSEQPSLKVTWLVLRDADLAYVLQRHVLTAYNALLRGDNEVRLEVKDSRINILRYVPDDGLSARTGLLLPRLVDSPISDAHYEMSLAAPLEPVMLASNSNVSCRLESGEVEVMVEASVVDFQTVPSFNGLGKRQTTLSSLGKFFGGRTVQRGDSVFPAGSQVVGWHNNPHQKSVKVPARQLHLSDPKLSAGLAAAAFAALATASCIIDGVARVREGDTFIIEVDGILEEALRCLCIQSNAMILEPCESKSADFVISHKSTGNLSINGSPLHIDEYLKSRHGSASVARAWGSRPDFMSQIKLFQLPEYRKAAHAAQLKLASTVLIHQNIDGISSHMVTYNSTGKLLAEDGIYIVIGGLGGLGRYVCSWMVAHGAKRLVAISRSGISSEGAQETFQAISGTGSSMQVIKADACDHNAVIDILTQVRRTGSIRGIVNLAMVLGDAPMEDMTGDEWDSVLRVKIDSSWIFHEETLKDPLDIFIMFSSIASVLGNRNQGNYNVGNTFLNALAEYRQSLGLPAISIALGAMVDIGVLYSLGKEDMLQNLTRSGLSHLQRPHLAKIMEGAVLESPRRNRSLIVTGLDMFERVDGKIVDRPDQIYWTEVPEFGHLQVHRRSNLVEKGETKISLREKLRGTNDEAMARNELLDTFISFLSRLLGFGASTFTDTSELAMYGLDSLSAVSCQYWFFRELGVDVKVSEILGGGFIGDIVKMVMTRLKA